MTADEMFDEMCKAGYPPCLLRCSIALIKNGKILVKTKKSGNQGEAIVRLYNLAKEHKLI